MGKLTFEWQEYNHDYEKEFQDIITKDGKEHINCWPNANKWHVLTAADGLQIPDSEVTHVRLNKEENSHVDPKPPSQDGDGEPSIISI